MIVKVLPNDDRSRLARIGATGANIPITLKDACRDVFKDAISVATLMAEHRRGNLVIYKIGRQYFTTSAELKQMLKKCRMEQKPHRTDAMSAQRETEQARIESARAALRLTLDKLRSKNKKR
jgi:hypothetical protein